MIITPNLDNYSLYTYCGGLAVRQDRHTAPDKVLLAYAIGLSVPKLPWDKTAPIA